VLVTSDPRRHDPARAYQWSIADRRRRHLMTKAKQTSGPKSVCCEAEHIRAS
jgi:hypothetical protein